MLTAHRSVIIGSCLVVLGIAAACGGGPTSPSGIGATTIAGTVNLSSGGTASAAAATANLNRGLAATAATAATGLTVTVVGTNLSATVDSSGYFQLAGVPSGTVSLQFSGAVVNATVALSNVGQEQLIEIRVQVAGTSAVIEDEVRSNSKLSLCHSTGSGSYHMIEVSQSAEPAHRAHGDGKVGDLIPGQPGKVFDQSCRAAAAGASVQVVKSTNGQDANEAPGPTIAVGSPVTWTYVVTNTGTAPLTSVAVVDDRNVTVTCPGTTLAIGQSMTCTGTGVAIAGQYRNVGTVTASSATGQVTDTDASHYFGQAPTVPVGTNPDSGARVQLCHRTGNGRYQQLEVSASAEPAHRAHGDGKIGEAVPGMAGKVFGAGCSVN